MTTKVSYNLSWSSTIKFLAKLDEKEVCYTVYIDRHGRALIVLDMEPLWDKYKKPQQ
jgi:hypothetical protein